MIELELTARDGAPRHRLVIASQLLLLFLALSLGCSRLRILEQSALLNLGNVLMVGALSNRSEGEIRHAVEILQHAVKVNGPTLATSRSLAYIYEERQDYDGMAAALRDGILAAPRDVLLQYRIGNMYYYINAVDLAIAAWRSAGAAPLFFHRAVEANSQGDTEGALHNLDIAIQIEPKVSDAYYLRGRIFERQGRWSEAQANYAQAVRNKAFFWHGISSAVLLARAYTGLGYTTYQASGNLDEAVSALRIAIELNPGEGWAHIRLCDVYRLADRTATALEWCHQAVRVMPDQHWSYYSRGRTFMQAGEYESARRDFEMALTLAPSYTPAQSELDEILHFPSSEK